MLAAFGCAIFLGVYRSRQSIRGKEKEPNVEQKYEAVLRNRKKYLIEKIQQIDTVSAYDRCMDEYEKLLDEMDIFFDEVEYTQASIDILLEFTKKKEYSNH